MDLSVTVGSGVRLRVRHRPGNGARPFLLVHGLSSNACSWDEVADHLASEGHDVYAADMRGHGESDEPEDGYDTATVVADLAALVTALELSGVVVAGHSWGGHIALRLAAEHPAPVAALGLVDGGWVEKSMTTRSREEAVAAATMLRRSVTRSSRENMLRYLRTAHPDWSETAVQAQLADLRPTPDGTLTQHLADAHFAAIVRSMWDDDPARYFPAVKVPVVLIPAVPADNAQWGAQVRDRVEAAAAAMPQARVRWYVGGDHHLHAQQPDRLAADLLELAREAEAAREG